MLEMKGDVWDLAVDPLHDAVVIPTNIGYTKHGRNPMGAGLARQASDRYPSLQVWYGEECMKLKQDTPVVAIRLPSREGAYRCLVLFPTKPFDASAPQLSWKNPADLSLIERGLKQLSTLLLAPAIKRIFVPLLGCGNGGLQPSQVLPLMDQYLGSDARFVLVQPQRMKRGK